MRAQWALAIICGLGLAACQGPAPPAQGGPFGWPPPPGPTGLGGGAWFLLGLACGAALAWLGLRMWRGFWARRAGGWLAAPELARLLASLELLERVVERAQAAEDPSRQRGGGAGPGGL